MGMGSAADSSTSETLLRRLRRDPADQDAWTEFVQRYGPRIARWARRKGLQHPDVQDVVQDVLVKLVKHMQHFAYDPAKSFRGYLRTATQNAVTDFFKEVARTVRGSGNDTVYQRLLSVESQADLQDELSGLIDVEVLEEAQRAVQLRCGAKAWQVFQALVLEQRKGTDVARDLEMELGAVYMTKRRLKKMLQEKIAELTRPDAPDGECNS